MAVWAGPQSSWEGVGPEAQGLLGDGTISPLLPFPSSSCFWTVTRMQEPSYTCRAALDVCKQDLESEGSSGAVRVLKRVNEVLLL